MGDEKVDQSRPSALVPSTPTPSDQSQSTKRDLVPAVVETVPSSGKRQAFKDIRRQLSESDLATPGVQKMLLEELQLAEDKCELLEAYVERYHDADKRAAVLDEKLSAQTAFDVLFNISFGVGCAIIGLAPFFWEMRGSAGPLSLAVGIVLAAGATVASVKRR
jgi:hypothetical protein